jgi:hypothetical protein
MLTQNKKDCINKNGIADIYLNSIQKGQWIEFYYKINRKNHKFQGKITHTFEDKFIVSIKLKDRLEKILIKKNDLVDNTFVEVGK